MIVQQDLTNRVRDYFDLNVYETKVWLALLSKGVASVGEVASISRVPRSRAYDVLETLEKKGFAIIRMGKPVKYLGIKPQIILERIKNEVRKRAEEKVKDLSKIKDTEEFIKLNELYKNGINPIKRAEISSSLRGKSNISNFLKQIIKEAKKEVIICTNAQDVQSKIRLFSQTILSLKNSKVNLRLALSGEDALIRELEKKLNFKIKKINIDSKFFIIDRKEILFYLSKQGTGAEDLAIWLNSEFFVASFASIFDKAIGEKNLIKEHPIKE